MCGSRLKLVLERVIPETGVDQELVAEIGLELEFSETSEDPMHLKSMQQRTSSERQPEHQRSWN